MAPNLRKRSRPVNYVDDEQNDPSPKAKKRGVRTVHQKGPTQNQSAESFHIVFDLIEARANDPDVKDRPILYYPASGTEYIGYSPSDIYHLVNKAASYYSEIIPPRTSSNEAPKVVALLGRSTLDYFVTLLSISRIGHALLFLSPRISEEAHLSLINVTKACCLLVDDVSREMSTKLQRQLPHLQIGNIASHSEYSHVPSNFQPRGNFDLAKESQNLAWIIHSSGSTSLPKPTWISHSSALGNFKSAFDLVSFVTLPLFHAQGIGWVFRGIMNKRAVYLYPGESPLTATNLVKTLREHRDIQILLAVPYACRLLANSERGIELCTRLDMMFSGGAICPKPIGDKLVEAGVNLVSHFGSTETGQLMNSFRPKSESQDWDWLRPLESALPFVRWEPYEKEQNIFELVVLEGWPAKVTSNREDGAYATADLWERHPDYPKVNKWRYYARKDDTIVLVNGEKANPIIFEQLSAASSLVQEAIVFGSEKAKLGVFVIPKDLNAINEEIKNDVWQAIEKGNISMPAHAQLDRDMIKLLSSDEAQRIRRTDKGNIIRSAFYQDFAPEIDAAYEDVANSIEKTTLSRNQLVSFLRSEIFPSLSVEQQGKLDEGVDLFSLGIDSLQASRIRGAILKRGIDTGDEVIGDNIVFEFPSIAGLANELMRMQMGGATTTKHTVEERMQAMIDRNSANFEEHKLKDQGNTAGTIVITGATGSLGAHIVSQISFRDDVNQVVCLVRATSNEDALSRVQASLKERRVEACWEKIVAYPSDFGHDSLGLPAEIYEAVADNLKCVIHCAWAVNFNMNLESFEQGSIRGTRNLIDLCLRSKTSGPAEFVFCSSISAAANENAREILEDVPASLKAAQRTGYAQSKLVAENVCQAASKATGMTCKVLRIGQVVGDTKSGIWNRNEAVPMIMKSALTVGSLPMLEEWCSWLPVDTVAGIALDIAFADCQKSSVFNIVNPKTFHWIWDLLLLLREMGVHFSAEHPSDWLKRLRSVPDAVRNPPYKLIDFFESKYGKDAPGKATVYATEKAESVSPRLKHLLALDREMLYHAVRYILET